MARINRGGLICRARVSSASERVRKTQWIRRLAETAVATADNDKRANGR